MIYKAPTSIKNQGASLAYSIGEWCLSGCICDDDVVWCLDVVCTDTHKTLEHIFKILPLKFLAVFLSDCCSSYSHQWLATHLFISPMTASSPLTPVLADSAQPTRRNAWSVARTTTSATGASLQRPDHVCGTRYHST